MNIIFQVASPTIVLKRKIFGNNGMAESISRDVVEITTSKPVAIFNSALEHRVKTMDLAVSNHVDISHSILFREVMRDAQPGSTIFIGLKINSKFLKFSKPRCSIIFFRPLELGFPKVKNNRKLPYATGD